MTTGTAAVDGNIALSLRRLYFVRFAFAVVWAGLMVVTASTLNPASAALLVLYPVFDVVAAVVDSRSARTKPTPGLYVNMVVSLLAAVGLAVALSSGVPGVLVVWGAWASLSGLVQLVVGLTRRKLGGQWPMILSGGLSTVVGVMFVLQAGQPNPGLSALAGYATLGGVFFLVSALRLGRAAKAA
jgi:uncharacterized membrane protein HdeD (DUF308 family)